MSTGPISLIVLAVCIALLIVMIVRWKIHPFFTMVIVAILGGFGFGLSPDTIIDTVSSGFGSTIGEIGIIIILGCVIGIILEETDGALVIGNTILKIAGRSKSKLAMAVTGFMISIPVFSDSAIVITSPVAKAVSARSGVPLMVLAGALNAGILATHAMVPPTPGPIAAAGTFGADLGIVILIGLCAAAAYAIVGSAWANSKYMRQKYPHVAQIKDIAVAEEGEKLVLSDKEGLPSAFLSFGCILIPVLMIFANSFGKMLLPENSPFLPWLAFIGSPVFALLVGVGIALLLNPSKLNKDQVYQWFSAGVERSGFIIIACGAAGAFAAILGETGVGNYLGELIASTGLPSVFVPFIITALAYVAQGSATVASMTGAAITAPMIGALALNPAIATIAVCAGATFATHANCSHFWVVTQMFDDMPLKEGFDLVTVQTALGSVAAIIVVWLLSLVII